MPAIMRPSGTDEKWAEDCQFKSEDLPVFTKEEAQFTAKGDIDSRPSSKVWDSSCKTRR